MLFDHLISVLVGHRIKFLGWIGSSLGINRTAAQVSSRQPAFVSNRSRWRVPSALRMDADKIVGSPEKDLHAPHSSARPRTPTHADQKDSSPNPPDTGSPSSASHGHNPQRPDESDCHENGSKRYPWRGNNERRRGGRQQIIKDDGSSSTKTHHNPSVPDIATLHTLPHRRKNWREPTTWTVSILPRPIPQTVAKRHPFAQRDIGIEKYSRASARPSVARSECEAG